MQITTPPYIVQGPRSLYSPIARQNIFACIAVGHPAPRVTWFRDGERVHEDYNVRINATHLSINSFDAVQQGVYQCVVENEAGEAQARSMLTLLLGNSLRAVTNLQCIPLNFTHFLVSFESEIKMVGPCFVFFLRFSLIRALFITMVPV